MAATSWFGAQYGGRNFMWKRSTYPILDINHTIQLFFTRLINSLLTILYSRQNFSNFIPPTQTKLLENQSFQILACARTPPHVCAQAPRYPLTSATLGTLRSDDGDGDENVKKAIGLVTKTTILHVHHAFLYISLPSQHDYDVKMPNFTLYRGSTQETTKFSLSLSL